jgi:hypothetical protein
MIRLSEDPVCGRLTEHYQSIRLVQSLVWYLAIYSRLIIGIMEQRIIT